MGFIVEWAKKIAQEIGPSRLVSNCAGIGRSIAAEC
jgi:hypothetical protein